MGTQKLKMNKVTVTKKEMEAIESVKDNPVCELKYVLKNARQGLYGAAGKPLNEMSEEQIVLAWHGYAEIEKEYVSFDEAMKARKEGKKVLFHSNARIYELYPNDTIENTWANRFSLTDLVEGEWSIEGEDDNNE